MTVYPSLPHDDDFHKSLQFQPTAPPIELSFNLDGTPYKPSCSFYESTINETQPSYNPHYPSLNLGDPVPHVPPRIPPRPNSANVGSPISTVNTPPPRVPTPDFGFMPVSNQEINQMDEINLKDDSKAAMDDVKLEKFLKNEERKQRNREKTARRTAALVEQAKRRRAYCKEHKKCCAVFSLIISFLMICLIIIAVLMILYSQKVIFN
ncbi:hypothetical protein L596_015463 [Steinernema carpocapsae]|nr:hypothetical protein L596_015463 [Steinernema carpocapsae]